MTQKYRSQRLESNVKGNMEVIEQIFRRHHPEFDGMKLSQSKLVLEMQKHYAKMQKEESLLITN